MVSITRDTNMTSFDIYAIIQEIKRLENSIIDNIYQVNNVIGLKIRTKDGALMLLLEPSKRIHLTRVGLNWQATNFVKMIRKHLNGLRIKDISQHKFDRIVEILTDKNYRIIVEILTRGNFIVAQDQKILFALRHVHMRDRAIYPGAILKYPPGSPENPVTMSFEEFKDKLSGAKNLLNGLAKLGFGKKYSLEICYRCGIEDPKNVDLTDVSDSILRDIYNCIKELFNETKNNACPRVYFLENKPYVFAPIKLRFLERENIVAKEFESFSSALDFYFSHLQAETPQEKTLEMLNREREKLLKRIEDQRRRIEELRRAAENARRTVMLIYENMQLLSSILSAIKYAKLHLNLSWDEIIKKIEEGKASGLKDAKVIENITKDGKIHVSLADDVKLELDIHKELHEIAEEYFEKAKKYDAKIKTAEMELEKSLSSLKNLEDEIARKIELEKVVVKLPPRRWYDSFLWFISSDGFLVVGGKDAQSNERLVKKYMDANDIFMHAEIHGGAAVLIKNLKNREISETTLMEAAIFAASYSKAWQKGLNAIDVFWTDPENVSTSPPSGQYLPTGAFIIKKKNYLKNTPLRLAIGLIINKLNHEAIVQLMSAPPQVMKSLTPYYAVIAPGTIKKSDVAKMLIKKLKEKGKNDPYLLKALHTIKIEKIIELIPGPSRFLEEDNNGD